MGQDYKFKGKNKIKEKRNNFKKAIYRDKHIIQ